MMWLSGRGIKVDRINGEVGELYAQSRPNVFNVKIRGRLLITHYCDFQSEEEFGEILKPKKLCFLEPILSCFCSHKLRHFLRDLLRFFGDYFFEKCYIAV